MQSERDELQMNVPTLYVGYGLTSGALTQGAVALVPDEDMGQHWGAVSSSIPADTTAGCMRLLLYFGPAYGQTIYG